MNLPGYFSASTVSKRSEIVRCDLCIYGATAAGVVAAVRASQAGMRVCLVEFGEHLGGMTASGLGATDIGNKGAIGGIAREFYRTVGKHYGAPEQWVFEPSVAENIFGDWISKSGVSVRFNQRLASTKLAGNRITSIVTDDGTVYEAAAFIDATYEGDLLAAAGVKFHVGREANHVYRETLNGIHFGHPNHDFFSWVDPFVIPGKPDSGLLPGVVDEPVGVQGEGDHRVQAFNFRVCLTDDPKNRVEFPQPPGYDPARFELLRRYIEAGVFDSLRLNVRMPNGKTDFNNFGGFGSDNIGRNFDWPTGDYATRDRIFRDHVTYNLGLLYFLSNDDRLPAEVRKEAGTWGLPADEFKGSGHWPHQLYVREGRRMIGDYVMTEADCRGRKVCGDSVGLAAYTMDSHNCRRIVIDGRAVNEGNVEVSGGKPYPISFRSIVPREAECENLIVPVALSASHIAFGSIRMEPVFMVLGQSAAVIAAIAIQKNCSVQTVPYSAVRDQLLADGQVLDPA